MHLWTIQTLPAWQTLREEGVLRCEPAAVDLDFVGAYRWMATQMQTRLGPAPAPGVLPVWAWYQWEGAAKRRPDLRASGHLAPGHRGVRLALEVVESDALLSDFDLWHYVLNYWYLPGSGAEAENFEAELARHGLSYFTMKPLPDLTYHARTVQSWQRIFDLEWAAEEIASPKVAKSIQATMWQFTLEMVVEAQEFTAR